MNRLEIESVLEQIIAYAGQLLGTPDGYVYLEGAHAGEIEVKVGLGIYSQRIGYRLQVGEGVAGRVWQSGQTLCVDDYDIWPSRGAGYPYGDAHAVVGIPLKSSSQVVGVLGMSYAEPGRRFEDHQLELLDRFAQLASLALDNARLYTAAQQELAERKQAQEALRQLNQELEMRVQERTAQLARTNQELQKEIAGHKAAEEKLLRIAERQTLLYQVLRAVSGQLELDAVARLAVDAIVRFTGWPHVCFAVPNEAGTHWVVRAAGGKLAAEVGMTYPMGRGVIGRVFRTAQTQRVRDVRTDPDYTGEHPVLLSELTLPIKQGERVLAVLNLESDRPAAFGAEELQLGESLAEAIGLALENARLFQTVQVELGERQRAEAALRESEERYRLHFENVSDVVYSIDREFRLLSVSPSVARHLGYTPQELVGRPIQELGLVAPDCLEAAFRDTLRVLEGEHVESAVYTFVARDGRRLIGEVSGAPLLRDGQVIASVSVARDITQRVRAEEQIKASLHEKEVLLKEIHHRVKNNLQVISSLLSLQSYGIQDASALEMFRESQNRVRSMALIHERLYRSDDLARIDFAEYVRNLATFLVGSYRASARPITLTVAAQGVYLEIDSAVPCGLIINELVSNALKHAFPPNGDRSHDEGRPSRQDSEIRVELHYDGDQQLTLVVADNGVGFPEALDFRNTASLGLQLVNTLVNQLNGRLELDRTGGTRFKITFDAA
jgi:PAS domain S-box-containing protein